MSFKLIRNFRNSLRGLALVLPHASFTLELVIGIPLVCYLFVWRQSNLASYFFLASYFLLLSVELFNTAIERVCDRITTAHDLPIRDIKDIASAAVFIVLILNGLFLYLALNPF